MGHVNFPGLVRVTGAVLPDFRVRAHSLEVEALEPRNRVELTGDLICSARGVTVVRLGMRPEFEQRLINARRQLSSLDKEREQIGT